MRISCFALLDYMIYIYLMKKSRDNSTVNMYLYTEYSRN